MPNVQHNIYGMLTVHFAFNDLEKKYVRMCLLSARPLSLSEFAMQIFVHGIEFI